MRVTLPIAESTSSSSSADPTNKYTPSAGGPVQYLVLIPSRELVTENLTCTSAFSF